MGFGGSGSGNGSISSSSDVALSSPSNNDVLAYNTATSKWQNQVAPSAAVSSVAGKTGSVTLSKSDVGLGSVDNTSDSNKPISSATQAALDAKQYIVVWNGSAWPSRPNTSLPVTFISTMAVSATAPAHANLAVGDIWYRHPGAV